MCVTLVAQRRKADPRQLVGAGGLVLVGSMPHGQRPSMQSSALTTCGFDSRGSLQHAARVMREQCAQLACPRE